MPSRGQTITVSFVAWDTSANAGKTGDVANFTLRWIKDGTSAAPTNAASEVDATNAPGVYKITLTGTECTADTGVLAGKSSTANVSIIPITVTFELLPLALGANSNVKSDVRDYNGTAGTFAAGRPEVNATHAAGTAWNSGGITTGTFAAGAINAAAIGSAAFTNAKFASGAIAAGTFAAGAIDAAAIATNAIDADSLAADATTELQAGLATAANLTTALTHLTDLKGASWASGEDLHTLFANYTAARAAKLDNLDAAVTTRLASGNVTVGSIAAAALAQFFTVDSTKLYANAVAGSVVKEIAANGTATVSAASIRSAVGLASANLDTQLAALVPGSAVDIDVDIIETEVEDL